MKAYISCHDERDITSLVGPFEDGAWAQAWLEQHNHDIPEDEPDNSPKWADVDHYCVNIQTLAGDMHEQHFVFFLRGGIHEPGFDPDTLPREE